MTSSRPTVRALTEDELPAFSELLARNFLNDVEPHWAEANRVFFEPGRLLGAFDGDTLIGTTHALSRGITVPGRRSVPFAAVTCVGVAPDQRRRGVLSQLMRTQLTQVHEAGRESIAALWATESMIYRRYGYGLAAQATRVELPRGGAFRAGVELAADRVREVPREQALEHLKTIYAEVAPTRVGLLHRDEASWYGRLSDHPSSREGMSSLRFALVDDGYAVYRSRGGRDDRGPNGTLAVTEVVARTPAAYASLWRYLLDMDLVRTIETFLGIDDPLIHLLAEPMNVLRIARPSLWVRLVDVDKALTARGYLAPVDVVLELTDELCPWNAGRWRLCVDSSGEAKVTRTEDGPDLALDVLELGGAFLGATRLTTLAATGLVRELTEGSLLRTSAALLGEELPQCVEVF